VNVDIQFQEFSQSPGSLPMRRIKHSSGVLGQARGQANSNHIDGSVQKELGWGGHSFTMGSASYETIMEGQPCAVYVSEKALIMMSVSDGDSAFSRMTRHNRQEQNWELKINSIQDIHVIKGGDLQVREFSDENKERLRQRCEVYIKNCPHVLFIDTYDSPQFSRHLLACWHSNACARTAGLGGHITGSNPRLAREYLDEVISCYAHTHDLKEKIEILEEISDEVLQDLELKEAVLRHRELLVLVLASCHKALNAPSGYEEEVEAKIHQVVRHRNVDNDPSTSTSASRGDDPNTVDVLRTSDAYTKVTYDVNLQHKLEQTVMNRLHFFHASLRFIFSVFFGSESVSGRSGALTEGDPLSPSAWLEFLAPDLFAMLCKRLQCNLKARHDKKTEEKLNELIGEAPSPYVSADLSGSELAAASSGTSRDYPHLEKLVRSVADYQVMATVELCRIASMGIQDHRVGMSRTHNRIFLQRSHIPMGDLWVRQADFDLTLDALLTRIAALLDDIVLTERRKLGSSASAGTLGRKPRRDESPSRVALSLDLGSMNLSGDNPGILESGPKLVTKRQPSVPPSPGKPKASRVDFGTEMATSQAQLLTTPAKPVRRDRDPEERRKRRESEKLPASAPSTPMAADRFASPEAESKRAGKRDSFIMMSRDYKDNNPLAVADTNDIAFGKLETQEVLLHYYCQLLRQLTYDSPKARDVLGKECGALWPPIIVILDIICPRQDDADAPVKSPRSPRSDNSASGMPAARKGVSDFLKGCFGNGSQRHAEAEPDINGYASYLSATINVNENNESEEKHAPLELTWNPITSYGPARVSINKHAWDLLVLSRRCIEECMDLMGLHRKATHKQMQKRYRSVKVDGSVMLQEVFIVEKRLDVTMEVTPRLASVATEAKSPLANANPPVRPPRRRQG